jgi:hypothetical protein
MNILKKKLEHSCRNHDPIIDSSGPNMEDFDVMRSLEYWYFHVDTAVYTLTDKANIRKFDIDVRTNLLLVYL